MCWTHNNELLRAVDDACALRRPEKCQRIHTGLNNTTRTNTYTNLRYNEKQYYDYNNPGFSGSTGHFTQVMLMLLVCCVPVSLK